jgi:non-specific protein-tyrosine kinase
MSTQGPPVGSFGDQAPDVQDHLRSVWKRKWLILFVTVAAAAITYVLVAHRHASQRSRTYTTSTEVYIEAANPAQLINVPGTQSGNELPPDGQQMSDIATLFTAQSITQAVYQRLGMPVGSAGSVNVGLNDTRAAATYGTSIVVVGATSRSGPLAARLANTYVAEFLASRRRAQAAAAAADAKATRAQLDLLPHGSAGASERRSLGLQIAQLQAIASDPSAGAYQVSPAPIPALPTPTGGSRGPVVDAVIAGLVAFLLAIGFALAASLFDRRLRRVSAVESSFSRPVLAVLPHVSKPVRRVNGHSVVPTEFVEPLRSLRVNLRLLRDGVPPRTVVVTSAVPGEGKSTVAADLALVCAESGERVLLMDADLRRPTISSWFDIDKPVGLTQVLRGEASLAEAVVSVQPPRAASPASNGKPHESVVADPRMRGGMDVLVHGELVDNPGPLLAGRTMAAALSGVSSRYDVVIVDTAPVLAVADTVAMLGNVDAVVFVARLGVTTRDAAERLGEVVARVPNANVMGVVANDVRDSILDSGYGGFYSSRRGYGYGYGNGNGHGARRGRAAETPWGSAWQ